MLPSNLPSPPLSRCPWNHRLPVIRIFPRLIPLLPPIVLHHQTIASMKSLSPPPRHRTVLRTNQKMMLRRTIKIGVIVGRRTTPVGVETIRVFPVIPSAPVTLTRTVTLALSLFSTIPSLNTVIVLLAHRTRLRARPGRKWTRNSKQKHVTYVFLYYLIYLFSARVHFKPVSGPRCAR